MNRKESTSILSAIKSPADVRQLGRDELIKLCSESREYLIDSILKHGGHFSGNLGVVELTVALHYLLNLPEDTLIWDVGHQAYLHKIFTGRSDWFSRIRHYEGLSGFPKRDESEYDAFGTGHSSTSISACLGFAEADFLKGDPHRHVAVIGDGSLTGGMAWEALNNAGVSKADITVIVNDNQIGIDPNEGAIGKMLSTMDPDNQNVFTELGFSYFGPVDGHDLNLLIGTLEAAFSTRGPKVVHIKTVKGKGYTEAEQEQTKWHAVKYVKIAGENTGNGYKGPRYQDVFGEMLCDLAGKDDRIIGVTPAMPSGSSMDLMMKKFPDRTFDVGIAEQHAITFSAGLAARGMRPFCNIYSTFLQRGYDQLIHDIGLQNLPVRLFLDRAGVVGEDGPTHHGLYDLVYLKTVPGLVVAAPMNGEELKGMMKLAATYDSGPLAIRYPRGRSPLIDENSIPDIEPGKARLLSEGSGVVVLSIGHIGNEAAKAIGMMRSKGVWIAHVDMRFAQPLDVELLINIFERFEQVFTIEDGLVDGGFGSSVNDLAMKNQYKGKIVNLGFPNVLIDQDSRSGQYSRYELDAEGIYRRLSADRINPGSE